jgi:outer membrane protein assembly factor BamB
MRLGIGCAALAMMMLGLSSASRAAWVTYQGDAAHSGHVPGVLDTSTSHLLWQKPVASSNITGLAVGGDTVFVTNYGYFSNTDTFHAIDQATGSPLWSKSYTSNFSTSAPAYANGVVYFQTDGHSAINGNYLRAYGARTGVSVFDATYDAQWETYLNPTPYNGNVFVGGGYYGGMYSINATTGARNWFGGVPQYDGWTPAIDGNYAYAFTGSGSTSPIKGVFTVLNLLTGATAASVVDPTYSWGGYTMNSAVVLGSNHDAFAINGGRLVCWDTTLDPTHTPHIAWSKTASFSGQPTLANGQLYTIAGGSLNVLDELTGNTLWTWTAPGGAISGPMIATDNLLFAQSGGSTYAVDLASHASVWSYPITGTMALSDSTLYVGSGSGSVYAIAIPEPATSLVAVTVIPLTLIARRRRRN